MNGTKELPTARHLNRYSLVYLLAVMLLTTMCGGDCIDYTYPDGVILEDGVEFEYIVVGAGASGAALATRLALAGGDVLLLEAGGDPSIISTIPATTKLLLGSHLDYKYETIPNNISCLAFRNHQCRFSRGKCLGGSTSINDLMYSRGSPEDFDEFNIDGWTWKDIQPYFLRYEGLKDLDLLPASSIPFHNTSGTMEIGFTDDPENPWHSRIVEAMQSLNFPYNPDINARSQIGVSRLIAYVYEGSRMSTARGYLARDDVKRKLNVAKYARCTGVIIDDEYVARGVTVVVTTSLIQRELHLYATKEVILTAGTIATPQILMLSGIGPAEHLRDMDIPVRVDLSVGDDMYDHVAPLIIVKVDNETRGLFDWLQIAGDTIESLAELLVHRDGPLTSIDLTDISSFANTLCYDFDKRQLSNDSAECQVPSLQVVHAYMDRYLFTVGGPIAQNGGNFGDDLFKQLAAVSADYAIIILTPIVLHAQSRGTVRLASADPLADPAIFPNYLSDEQDLEEMMRSMRIMRHMVETPLFKSHGASIYLVELPGCPDHDTDSEGYWRCYARHMTQSIFHAAGTTALGRVVDERLRVRGVQRLRVADLGVLPRPTRSNTAAVAIAIGERAADFIMEDNED